MSDTSAAVKMLIEKADTIEEQATKDYERVKDREKEKRDRSYKESRGLRHAAQQICSHDGTKTRKEWRDYHKGEERRKEYCDICGLQTSAW